MKNEYIVAIVAGLVLLSLSYTIAPQSLHYSMMVSPLYGIVPSILALVGVILIITPIMVQILEEKEQHSQEIIQVGVTKYEEKEITGAEKNGSCEKIAVAEKLLDEDERKIFGIVVENEGITQDSLHFRTGFSHSKISMIIKKLEEKDLIYRERFGKTYRIYMSDWIKK